MEGRLLIADAIEKFQAHLAEEECSQATIEKYMRDIRTFAACLSHKKLTKEVVIEYKQNLIDRGYATRSINSMLASLNSLFSFLGWTELKVKVLKVQKPVFCPEEKELTRAEYERLCRTAEKLHKHRLSLILQTIGSTGIRVSELKFITTDAVKSGNAVVSLKGKVRTVFLPIALRKKLTRYIKEEKIVTGSLFVTRSGHLVNRSSVWREMKKLCSEARVAPGKVFPHNLRHLFARIFYRLEKDIVKLSDVLGHSSINTTRLYIISSGDEHRKCLEQMRLVV